MVISKVIAGNIALSLGMVGALSIVRFRNPVKNPFELVLYFALLTLGITLGVKLLWGIAFALITILIILISNFFKSKTSISFQEGKEIYSIEIKTKNEINNLLESRNLKTYTEFSDENNIKNFVYFLCYNEKEKIMNEATKLKTLIKDKDAHIQINL
jgi:membrane protein insertase Oxa1/YidC/SpoIIIJ